MGAVRPQTPELDPPLASTGLKNPARAWAAPKGDRRSIEKDRRAAGVADQAPRAE